MHNLLADILDDFAEHAVVHERKIRFDAIRSGRFPRSTPRKKRVRPSSLPGFAEANAQWEAKLLEHPPSHRSYFSYTGHVHRTAAELARERAEAFLAKVTKANT